MKNLRYLVLGLLAGAFALQPFRGLGQSGEPIFPIAEAVTPQIRALAQGLQNDPVRIFNYVHDHIRYVHYFGSKKGAELTLLEKSGNDFDQSALLVALLSAAGYSNNVSYQFGWIGTPYNDPNGHDVDLSHWLQLTLDNTNWSDTVQYLRGLFSKRGYPEVVTFGGFDNLYLFQHVWIKFIVGGVTNWLDPSVKISEPVPGIINLVTATGFSSNNMMSASVAGGTDTGNYVTNLNEANIRSALTGYTTSLLNYLQSNAPNASVQQVLGGWQIVPSTNTTLSDISRSFPFDVYTIDPILDWTYEPTNLMASLTITFAGTNYQLLLPQLQGQRLSLTFSNNGLAQLWLEDNLLAQNGTSASGSTNVVFAIKQPYGTWDDTSNILVKTGYDDYVRTNVCQSTNATYALSYSFEPDWGWLQERQKRLDAYRQAGLGDTSRQVVSETLNIMGLNWMLESASVDTLLANQLGVLPEYVSRFGRVAQEAGRGYYFDIAAQNASFSSAGIDFANLGRLSAHDDLVAYFGSALEHGIIEQLQTSNLVAGSTIKMLQIANTNGQAVYLASSTNWATVKNKLVNYDTTTSNSIVNYINAGYSILLPQNGSNHLAGSGSWAGCGYEARLWINSVPITNETAMLISGGYNGGVVGSSDATINTSVVDQYGNAQPDAFSANSPFTYGYTGADPVDMADGTFQVEHTDLSLGQAEPRGITLSRYYNGTRRYVNSAGMAAGWVHNYMVNASTVPAPQASLGGTTPQQMAPIIAATTAAVGLYNSLVPDPKNWMVSALIAKWGIDQLNKTGVSISMGKDTVQFVKQPNGTFTPPANCTMTLLQTNSVYWLQQRHGNTFQFDALGRLTNIVDQYNQNLAVTYLSSTSSLPYRVTDWKKNRTLTFNYTGNQLTSVTDGAHSISYGYNSQGDLTSFTDAEGKTSTYTYDTNHDITATIDAANRLVVSNLYDALGHVAIQYTQGDTNKMWQIFWSGWQTIAQDPAGGQQVFNYDDQSRVIASQDALGNLTQTYYDGQSHVVQTVSPLNETNQFVYDGNHNLIDAIDPLNHTNQFFYDSQNRLTRSLDPLNHPTTYGYNAQFSLTGQTNGAGDWVTYAYNTDGTLHTRSDAGGQTTYNSYDAYGQLAHITYPGGLGGESFGNDPFGDVTNHTDARGFATTFQYNNRRQLTNTFAPTNLITSVSFDAVGNVASLKDARGNITSNTWSATRHLLTTTFPATPQGTPVITNGYDSRDWLTRTVDPFQNPTLYTNDLAGRLISVTDPVLRTTTFDFDADGRKLATVNAANETNSQTWDARGSLIKLTDGAGHYSTRSYDADGNQIILTNRNGKKWQFQFDAANRLTNTITPLGFSTSLTFNHQGLVSAIKDQANQPTSLYYDAKGRLTNRTDNVGSTFYRYDANDNPTNILENGKSNSWTFDAYNRVSTYQDVNGYPIQYRYDANGNLTNLIYPGNRVVAYAYDSLNRLTNITDWAQRKTSITYDLAGHIKQIKRPNGSYRTINYDAAGQATNIMEQMANTLPIAIFNCNWTNNGSMGWEFAAPLSHAVTVPTRTMTYDDDNRLYQFQGPTMGGLQPVGMDANGNLTSGPLTNDTFATYAYDARNRLLSAGGVTNAYDAMNNRISQTVGTNTTTFVVNPNAKLPQVLMRIKSGVTNYYIYGVGLLYQITETATATNTLTYHYDYRGSTIALSADNGLVTDRIEYSLYGSTTYRVGTSDTPFLFNGRYGVMTDPNGLLCMRERYYNPYLCRFISADPSGFAGGLNFYAYANGNPVSLIDPFGLGAQSTGDSSWSWMGLYNSVATAVVPGQASWNNAQANFSAGNYGMAALNTLTMVGEQALFVATLGASSEVTPVLNSAPSSARSEMTSLYRAVNPAELEDLNASGGVFRNPPNIGGGIKYFSTTPEGAAAETQGWWSAGAGGGTSSLYQGPYTIVQTAFPTSMITPAMTATVDGGVNSVILSTEQLPSLLLGKPLTFTPLP